jgi:tetratricopeptide (TPR) repeat protein
MNEENYKKGKEKYKEKEYEKAIEIFSIIIYKEENYNSYFYRGMSYRKKGIEEKDNEKRREDFQNAFEDFSSCVFLNANKLEAFERRAFISHYYLEEYNIALIDYDYLIKKNEKGYLIKFDKILLLYKIGEKKEVLLKEIEKILNNLNDIELKKKFIVKLF